MAAPQFQENPALGQELLIGISVLTADTLQRSGLLALAGITYSSIELTKLHTADEEISLFVGSDEDGNHIVTLSENPRARDSEDEMFDLGPMTSLTLQKDGSGIAPHYGQLSQDETLFVAAEHIIRRLPDFIGAAATIEVLVEEVE